jgi:hypothetical protein
LQTILIEDALLSINLFDNMERAYRFDILANSPATLQAATDILLSRPNVPYMKDKIRLNWDDEITSVAQLRQVQNKGCEVEVKIE